MKNSFSYFSCLFSPFLLFITYYQLYKSTTWHTKNLMVRNNSMATWCPVIGHGDNLYISYTWYFFWLMNPSTRTLLLRTHQHMASCMETGSAIFWAFPNPFSRVLTSHQAGRIEETKSGCRKARGETSPEGPVERGEDYKCGTLRKVKEHSQEGCGRPQKVIEGRRQWQEGPRRGWKVKEGRGREGETIEGHRIPWKEGQILWESHGISWNLMESWGRIEGQDPGNSWKVLEPHGRLQKLVKPNKRVNKGRKTGREGHRRTQKEPNKVQ